MPDVLDLAAVEPLPGVPQHDPLLLFPGCLDIHPWQVTEKTDSVRAALKDYLLLRNKLAAVTLNPEDGGTRMRRNCVKVFIMSSTCLV